VNGDIDYSKRDHARQTAEQIARNTAAAHAIVHACQDILRETLVFDGLELGKDKIINDIQKKTYEILMMIERIEE
jgi:hypothetical protein